LADFWQTSSGESAQTFTLRYCPFELSLQNLVVAHDSTPKKKAQKTVVVPLKLYQRLTQPLRHSDIALKQSTPFVSGQTGQVHGTI
jgi:hypothetical protein